MNINEAKKLLEENGIYQLNKGETLHDALNSVKNKQPRKGYRVKFDDGRRMSESQIIQNENKEAFGRSFTPATYSPDNVESIDDICDSEDMREDKTERGMIANCYYCGTCIRIDGDGEDYDVFDSITHCDNCMCDAIMENCM